MQFEALPPSPPLRMFVQYFWRVRGRSPLLAERFLPGVAPVLIVSKTPRRPPLQFRGETVLQPTSFLKGILGEYALLGADGEIHNYGVAFAVGAARALIGAPLFTFGEQIASTADLEDAALSETIERVRGADTLAAARDAFELLFLARLRQTSTAAARVRRLLARAGSTPTSVRRLAADVGLSERQLRRVFADEIGASPQTYGRILRLRRASALLRSNPRRLADIAASAGYYDQAHFTREFRAMVGVTPARYRVDPQSVAAHFRDGRSVQYEPRLPAPTAGHEPADRNTPRLARP